MLCIDNPVVYKIISSCDLTPVFANFKECAVIVNILVTSKTLENLQ